MSHKRSQREDKSSDDPPMSRLFVICNKNHTEADLQDEFEKFGTIEEIWCVKNRSNGENKGVAYIKFTKTSNAAMALEEMNGKIIGNNSGRPLKVLVASSREQGSGRQENEQEKYLRLFVIVAKDASEENLNQEFSQYGDLDNVVVIRDKATKENKGFAYIKYHKFSDAAVAFENCHPRFKAVFAEPKSKQKHQNSDRSDMRSNRERDRDDYYMPTQMSTGINRGNDYSYFNSNPRQSLDSQLKIICSKMVNQDQLWRLFDIIPGLDYCQITGECGRNSNYATAMYSSTDAAIYAREKLHGLEYPAGERLIIKSLAEFKSSSNGGGSGNNNGNGNGVFSFESVSEFCNVNLPPICPMADPKANCAQRLFIVCVPKALSQNILTNVFSRFPGLIDIYMLGNKNCGFAKYTDESSAMRAIELLHGAEVCGVKLKVMEAEELRDAKRKRYDD